MDTSLWGLQEPSRPCAFSIGPWIHLAFPFPAMFITCIYVFGYLQDPLKFCFYSVSVVNEHIQARVNHWKQKFTQKSKLDESRLPARVQRPQGLLDDAPLSIYSTSNSQYEVNKHIHHDYLPWLGEKWGFSPIAYFSLPKTQWGNQAALLEAFTRGIQAGLGTIMSSKSTSFVWKIIMNVFLYYKIGCFVWIWPYVTFQICNIDIW